jgi:phage tail sheath protein FI
MPEYLAPGVYVEEVSYRTRSIEGVSTTTTAFVGPTRFGPLHDPLDIITNLNDFELNYGDGHPLTFTTEDGDVEIDNWMWHAVRAFFAEGGRRLYVKRIYNDGPLNLDGRANLVLLGETAAKMTVFARHPGAAGELHVTFTVQAGQNVLTSMGDANVARGLAEHDLVMLTSGMITSPPESPPHSPPLTLPASVERYIDLVTGDHSWRFRTGNGPGEVFDLSMLEPSHGDLIQPVTVTVSIGSTEPGSIPRVWVGLPLDSAHQSGGAPDSLAAVFDPTAEAALLTPISLDLGQNHDGRAVLAALDAAADGTLTNAVIGDAPVEQRSLDIVLQNGSDGFLPSVAEYEGAILANDAKTGLVAFEDIDDISIVAAPGCTYNYESREDDAQACVDALINHARRMRYMIAIVDSGNKQTIAQVRAMRAKFDTNYAAFYYPWIRILDPLTGQVNFIPPCGVVAGIYARNDVNRAVYKAPANEVVNLSIGFERLLSKSQQEVLNPEGINCFRYFPGRGYRLWGARMMSSDSEWKYVNLRRYFAFLEHSIDRGTQWAVFEPNGERLWAMVRGTIDDFLLDQWQNGALLGDKPEKAYFVKCDRSTMTQNDLDNGRLVCQIGVAPLRPAEFVIFRIGQWTADRKV